MLWTKCENGLYHLDCWIQNGFHKMQAYVSGEGERRKLFIHGVGLLRGTKTIREINTLLALRGLLSFQDTDEICPGYVPLEEVKQRLLSITAKITKNL